MDNESLASLPELRVRILPGKAIRVRPFGGGEAKVISSRDFPDDLTGREVIQYARNLYGGFVRRWVVFPDVRNADDLPYGILLKAPTYRALKEKRNPNEPDTLITRTELVDNLHDLWDEIAEVYYKHGDSWEEYF